MIVEEPSENYVTGWIRLYRSIQNKGWYSDSEYVHLWVHLLINANHKGKEFLLNGEIVRLKSGQFITGRKKLSEETGIKEWKIEIILKCFETDKQIQQQTNSRNRLISIVSWDLYQNSQQQTDSKPTASQQQTDTNNNDNNDNKEINRSAIVSEMFERFWEQYERKGSKKAAREKYMKLQDKDIEAINIHLPLYLKSKPEKQFRKDAERYLSNRLWENGDIQELKENTITVKLPDNWWHIDLTPQQWELVPEKYRSEKRNADIRRAMGV